MSRLQYKSIDIPFKARGRHFTSRQMETIAYITERYYHEGRTNISQRVCRAIRWKQPNGRLKDVACREVLRKLDDHGFISLPPPRGPGAVWKKEQSFGKCDEHDHKPLTSLDFSNLSIRLAKNDEIAIWNQMVGKYHYLHSSRIVGRQMKYSVYSDDQPIAFSGWGDSSWAVKDRDSWIGWNSYQRSRYRHLIINNVRFLILPWVQVPNLASHVIARCSKEVLHEWNRVYGFKPVLLETFVDVKRFSGTCYKAANWKYLGLTSGYAKSGFNHHNSQSPKALFVYSTNRYFKEVLRGKHK